MQVSVAGVLCSPVAQVFCNRAVQNTCDKYLNVGLLPPLHFHFMVQQHLPAG